jgi:RNA polymerase sporulation-specific sigma factor
MYFRGQKKTAGDVSLSGILEADGDTDGLSLMDTIADETDMLENLSRREDITRVRQAVEQTLTGRDAQIIRLRYGLSGQPPMPQRVVAQQLGISRSYVSRIEKKALEQLRDRMEAQSKE